MKLSPFVRDARERAGKTAAEVWPVALAGEVIDNGFHTLQVVHSVCYAIAAAVVSVAFSFASRTVKNDKDQRTASLIKPVEYA